MEPAASAPTIHTIPDDSDAVELIAALATDDPGSPGLRVLVHVSEGINIAYGRVVDEASTGNGSQRRLEHSPRGTSAAAWTELHHPRGERELGQWRAEHEAVIDRRLIQCCKQAWRLDAAAPYVAEFATIDLADVTRK